MTLAAFPKEYRIEPRKVGVASTISHPNRFSIFDGAESLVCDVWFDRASDMAKDIARRRAHAIRQMIDAEAEVQLAAAE